MLRYVLFDLSLFPEEDDRPSSEKRVLWLLEALTCCNQLYLRRNPNTPLIYQSGIKYKLPQQMNKEETPSALVREFLRSHAAPSDVKEALEALSDMTDGEHFRDIPRIIENGGGDCFPMSQKIIARSRSTGQYELLSLGELRHCYLAYEALSYNFRSCEYEFKSIAGFVDKGIKPVYKARLSNGTDLVATEDHKFWTLDGSQQQAPYPDSYRLGQRTMGEYFEAYSAVKSGDRGRKFYSNHSRILQAAKIPALNAVSISQAQAYLAGMYAAEGEFDGKHTRIGQHKKAIREKIEAALGDCDTSFHYQPGRGATPGSGAQYNLHGGRANPLVVMMRGQGTSSFDKRVPQGFLSSDEQTVARLLEGHGDGDAWRPGVGDSKFQRKGVSAVYASSSEALIEQLRLGTLILGRPTYNYRYDDHMGEGEQPIWRLHEYNDEASKLQARKSRGIMEDLPGLTYGTIRNIAEAGREHVGCIEVEGNHNFFLADGTLVSNCDNVAAWRCAELREKGIRARPYITNRKRLDGGTTYHVIVLWPDGSAEDPSLLLNMGGPAKANERDEERRKLGERMGDLLTGKLESIYGYGAQ